MKILFLSTADIVGGAAVATYRLVNALREEGVAAQMMVRDKRSAAPFVSVVPQKRRARAAWLLDRLGIFLHLLCRRKHLWDIDANTFGVDITQLPEYQEADIIHLAWVNQAFIARGTLRKIFASGKPVVWTLHDFWPIVGICHFPRRCTQYLSSCDTCPLLPQRKRPFNTLAQRIFEEKKTMYAGANIHLVACSAWLADRARQSVLSRGMTVATIPNAIDTSVFHPLAKTTARQAIGLPPTNKKVLLFVAQKITDERKGVTLLIDALHWLLTYRPQVAESIVVALVGKQAATLRTLIPLPCVPIGYVSGDAQLAQVYSASDIFVLPTMEDNLPNTIMEALASGVPVVAFGVGGVPEMISHKVNGYIAQEGSSAALAEGIAWVLTNNEMPLANNAVRSVAERYSNTVVAQQYIALYQQIIATQETTE